MGKLLEVGQIAPNFMLPSSAPDAAGQSGASVSLSDYLGQNVILVFYPADWSAVCGDELTLYNELLPIFETLNAVMLGISVDSAFSHSAFKEERNLHMGLLADFEPKGAVARLYGVYDAQDGFSQRALYVIDGGGAIRYSFISPMDVNPGASEIIKTLKAIQAGVKQHA